MNSPLISAADLLAQLTQPATAQDTLVVDCRFQLADPGAGEAAYAQGHLPGAVYAHLDRDLSGPRTGRNGRHPLPQPADLAATLSRWGLGPRTRVVAYDDMGGMFAARLWWLLRHGLGHEATQVLDGGWAAWRAAGGGTDTLVPTRPSDQPPAQVPVRDLAQAVVHADEVLAGLGQPDRLRLLDARAPDRFRGENETLDPVGGHIPGALNRFFQLNLQADGRFKPAELLRSEFSALLGGQAPETLVHQCGSGVTACHNLLAMDAAGLPGTRLYAGSWSEWCADPARPVARG